MRRGFRLLKRQQYTHDVLMVRQLSRLPPGIVGKGVFSSGAAPLPLPPPPPPLLPSESPQRSSLSEATSSLSRLIPIVNITQESVSHSHDGKKREAIKRKSINVSCQDTSFTASFARCGDCPSRHQTTERKCNTTARDACAKSIGETSNTFSGKRARSLRKENSVAVQATSTDSPQHLRAWYRAATHATRKALAMASRTRHQVARR